MESQVLEISDDRGVFRIRPVVQEDNDAVRDIILETLIEHGAIGPGFASGDADTRQMFQAFSQPGRKYFVIESGGAVVGGAGIAPLPGEEETCELVKMYFRPGIRGLGLGSMLLRLCLEEATAMGYRQIYLETLENMKAARRLYEHLGFEQIPCPMGDTGHFSCDIFYRRPLV